MSWGTDFYHATAGKYEVIKEISADLSYEFDLIAIIRNKESGEVRWGRTTGCSCPPYFHEYNGFDDLNPLENREDYQKLEETVNSLPDNGYYYFDDADKTSLLKTAAELTR